MNIYTVILDISILVVLCMTIVFCLKLNSRIIALQNNKAELEGFIKSLDTAIINSHRSILNLKEITEKAEASRQKYVTEANELANELSTMISSGNRLMQRSDENIKAMEDLLIKVEKVKAEAIQEQNDDETKNEIN